MAGPGHMFLFKREGRLQWRAGLGVQELWEEPGSRVGAGSDMNEQKVSLGIKDTLCLHHLSQAPVPAATSQ